MKDPRRKEIRTLLRIHPDGGENGTAGCIGILGSAATLRQFKAGMDAEMKRHGAAQRIVRFEAFDTLPVEGFFTWDSHGDLLRLHAPDSPGESLAAEGPSPPAPWGDGRRSP